RAAVKEGSLTLFRMAGHARADWELLERGPDGKWATRTIEAKDTPQGLRYTCTTCRESELFATVRELFLEWLEQHETCLAPAPAQKRASK
ncbi:MAG: hypothetical protein ACRCU1_10625, partial [Alsobacter sp.]